MAHIALTAQFGWTRWDRKVTRLNAAHDGIKGLDGLFDGLSISVKGDIGITCFLARVIEVRLAHFLTAALLDDMGVDLQLATVLVQLVGPR